MAKNTNLHSAKRAKNDEFYTRLEDVEAELQHYPNAFRGKVVYLNCDDERSAFWEYFSQHFTVLGLNELVATKYPEGLLFRLKSAGGAVEVVELEGDGDFRSPECVELLKRSDIVVTNPPFSLFREYIGQLMEYGKKFLVIGNMIAIIYKEVWPYIQEGDLWLGVQSPKRFIVGDTMPDKAGQTLNQSGEREQAFGNILWFTNLDHYWRHQPIPLAKTYTSEEFPNYDNYDAIEVSKVKDIPADYDGVMGVPITFLGKWNPDQFEILGISGSGCVYNQFKLAPGMSARFVEDYFAGGGTGHYCQGNPNAGLYKNGAAKIVYTRIFIRRRQLDRV